MINKINFTGRETMLTNPIKTAQKIEAEYISEGKIYSKEAIQKMIKKPERKKAPEATTYTNPFSQINTKAAASTSVDFFPESAPHKINIKA